VQQHETLSLSAPNTQNSSFVPHLKTITPIGLPINHIQHLILHLPAPRIPRCPIIARARPLLQDVEVLRVVDVPIRARLDAIDDARFEVEEDGARDVAGVVGLVEEDVFAVAALGREVGEVAVLVDAVFLAELLPELAADCARESVGVVWCGGCLEGLTAVTALAGLERDDLAGEGSAIATKSAMQWWTYRGILEHHLRRRMWIVVSIGAGRFSERREGGGPATRGRRA
jgi:hypothetical protein